MVKNQIKTITMHGGLKKLQLTATAWRSAGNRISAARPRRKFFNTAALLKYNRITKAERICSVAGILAMQCCAQSIITKRSGLSAVLIFRDPSARN